MKKNDALIEISKIEIRIEELRKIIEQPEDITGRVTTLEQPEDITGRVTTLEQAKESLGIKDDCFSTNKHSKRALAFQNLCIVIEALNEGWVPNFENANEDKYYNYFTMNGCVSCYRTDTDYDNTLTGVPLPLLFKTKALAKHCINRFLQLYKDLYL